MKGCLEIKLDNTLLVLASAPNIEAALRKRSVTYKFKINKPIRADLWPTF